MKCLKSGFLKIIIWCCEAGKAILNETIIYNVNTFSSLVEFLVTLDKQESVFLPLSEICLKLLTIVSLLILSNTSIVIAYYSICFFCVFNSFYLSLL